MSYKLHLEPDTRCWIEDPKQGWIGVNVQKVKFDEITKKYTIEMVSDANHNDCFSIETNNFNENNKELPLLRNLDDNVNDLTTLSHLNEPSLLNAIKVRYGKQQIYTYSGIVLVAMNPFKSIESLYDNNQIIKYHGKNKNDNLPHLFAIADEAYRMMKLNGVSQSIIVSGESGAGKTVSAKYIMRFFAYVHSSETSQQTLQIEKQILATNPILEAFGNAKTTRNDNSSRFGKYLEIQFDKNASICGAVIKTYLLERSRLVTQPENERNYHIFYQLVRGLPKELKEKFGLKNIEDYNYLYQGRVTDIEGVVDSNDFKETCDALTLIGIDFNRQKEIFKVLAALLHIGNIEINKSRDTAYITENDPSVEMACSLLGINSAEFTKWLLRKKISTKADSITSNLKFHEALAVRDSISKHIYSSLFNWLIDYINTDLATPNPDETVKYFIGVLDIYGFEHFENNSFEQFCINYANEKLQQEFTQHVFKLQQEEYIDEGIEWSFIEFADNQQCIEVIENNDGILSLLDEQSRLPSGSEQAWADKMFHGLVKPPYNKVFKKARFGNEKFIVSHYALDVTYTIDGFLEKNRDTVSDVLKETLANSSNTFLTEILDCNGKIKDTNSLGGSKISTRGVAHKSNTYPLHNPSPAIRRRKKPTLGSIFKASLLDLMQTINTTDVHYIRCIKPNETKTAWEFSNSLILSQLRACGVLETIKISMVGYQSKYTYDEFLYRFVILLGYSVQQLLSNVESVSIEQKKNFAHDILKIIGKDKLYQLGKTKIFFKAGVLSELEIIKTNKVRSAAVVLQKHMRRYSAQHKYKDIKDSAVLLQSLVRSYLVKLDIKKRIQSVVMIQSLLKGTIYRNDLQKCLKLITSLEAIVRAKTSRVKCEKLNEIIQREILEEKEMILMEEETAEREKLEQEMAMKEKLEQYIAMEEEPIQKNNIDSEKEIPLSNGFIGEQSELYNESTDELRSRKESEVDEINSDENSTFDEKNLDSSENDQPVRQLLDSLTSTLVLKMHKITENLSLQDKQIDFTLDQNTRKELRRGVHKMKIAFLKIDLEDLETRKNATNQSIYSKKAHSANSSNIKFNADEAKRNYAVSLQDLNKYLDIPAISCTTVVHYISHELKPPSEDYEEEFLPPNKTLITSYLTNQILKEMWKQGFNKESAIFLYHMVESYKKSTESIQDLEELVTQGVYYLSNFNEVSKFVNQSRESILFDLDDVSDLKKRSENMRLMTIMKRYFNAAFAIFYNTWMKGIMKELDRRIIDAIVLDGTLYSARKSQSVYFRKLFQKGRKYKMFDVVRIFSNVHLTLTSYSTDVFIINEIMHDMLRYVDARCFNNVIQRSNYLSYDRGILLKYNLSLLIDWCHENSIDNSPDMLLHMLTLCQVLVLKKQGMADATLIADTCQVLNVKQVQWVMNHCFTEKSVESKSYSPLERVLSGTNSIKSKHEDLFIDVDESWENMFVICR
ncbi:hypothetical protein DAMA08_041510 [Martiniozyma asiatica (nom. inval.)]|nr:hypothetical protein DAMA08_041510 [Martiniozyma asiatica]